MPPPARVVDEPPLEEGAALLRLNLPGDGPVPRGRELEDGVLGDEDRDVDAPTLPPCREADFARARAEPFGVVG